MKYIYLDNNATTEMRKEVLDAMIPYLSEHYGNPSSVHRPGRKTHAAIDEARASVRGLIAAERDDEIYFTSGGTESNNLAIKGVAHALRARGTHIITSSVEHYSVLNACKFLEGEGFRVTYVPVDRYGCVDPKQVTKAITDQTILISVIFANNEVGTIEPIGEIGCIAKERGIAFHTDAVQAAGKIPIDVARLNIDLLSVSAHKFYGPKGSGALYIKKKTSITPLSHGGHHERNMRAGTENVAGIVGLAVAAALANEKLAVDAEKTRRLRDLFEQGVLEKIPNVAVHGHPEKRLPNTSNISFRFVENESVILNLDIEGIAVSSGSACTSGSLETSHVLQSMGIPPDEAGSAVRFSLGRHTGEGEIQHLLNTLPGIIERLRDMSPSGRC
ncbi:MAG: cysteine desulfurase NifS [Candidatus Omnitrophota bacterium]